MVVCLANVQQQLRESPSSTEDRGGKTAPEVQLRNPNQAEQSIAARKPSASTSEPTESGSTQIPSSKPAESQVPVAEAAGTAPKSATDPPGSSSREMAAVAAAAAVRIRITDRMGDLFAAPPNSVLVHACNALGSWGGGIALAFRGRYPDAFKVYRAHCARSTPDRLVGTALLIRPPASTAAAAAAAAAGGGGGGGGGGSRAARHYVGCLFTSRAYGKSRDPPESILAATGPAMRHLMKLIAEEEKRIGAQIGEVRMCRINSGLFAVPWEKTKKVIEDLELAEGEVPGKTVDRVLEIVAWERE
ncbi:hypothetical protein VTH82DRAFT_278 [Thermothelomyces myriococcoides]